MADPNIDASPDFPSSSTSSARRPARAAATARAAAVVVLPTPPFPATMITRDEEHHSASSIASHARRPPLRRPLFAVLTLLCVALPWATSAGAAEFAKAGERHMEVVQVEGAIDPVVAALITSSLRRAQTNGASVVILQIDSKGALDTDPAELLGALGGNRVPLGVWVGPGKATARGAAAFLVAAASFSAASPGASVGPVDPLRLDRTTPLDRPGGIRSPAGRGRPVVG